MVNSSWAQVFTIYSLWNLRRKQTKNSITFQYSKTSKNSGSCPITWHHSIRSNECVEWKKRSFLWMFIWKCLTTFEVFQYQKMESIIIWTIIWNKNNRSNGVKCIGTFVWNICIVICFLVRKEDSYEGSYETHFLFYDLHAKLIDLNRMLNAWELSYETWRLLCAFWYPTKFLMKVVLKLIFCLYDFPMHRNLPMKHDHWFICFLIQSKFHT